MILDYEQKYKEALERAKEFYNNEGCRVGMTPIDLEVIFPELKGSNDANKVGVEQEQEPPSEHWQAVREMAAITALQGFISSPKFDRFSKTFLAEEAVKCADALVEKLKGE